MTLILSTLSGDSRFNMPKLKPYADDIIVACTRQLVFDGLKKNSGEMSLCWLPTFSSFFFLIIVGLFPQAKTDKELAR